MKYEVHPDLGRVLSKIAKKDKSQFEKILKKIDEIIHLRSIRVHIGNFVLLFKLEGEGILFRYYDHHDNIYKWRPKNGN